MTMELLTPEEMGAADRATIEAGTPGFALMQRAGNAVATAAQRLGGRRVTVLAGPGNNGGDGLVAATILAGEGHEVSVRLLGARERLKGDAAIAAGRWQGGVEPIEAGIGEKPDLIIDALFGAGLDRPVEGPAAAAIEAANASGAPIIAVDLPSGIDGRSGAVLGTAIQATETVTFFRMKPGHLLIPGRALCGPVTIADIGIPDSTLAAIRPQAFHNVPALWLAALPRPRPEGHKYDRGHAVVVSGPMTRTGAARLAARAALRVGAGLVTVASPPDALAVNAAHLTAIMLLRMDGVGGLREILADARKNAVVMGPALGVGDETVGLADTALASEAALVLDADAITSFKGRADTLFDKISRRGAPVVLTPHEGEFGRLFPDLAELTSKLERAREAAKRSGATILLKGPDTVVASPDGRAAIADNAPPWLATAGAGDVLAGFVSGLLAQGMPAFEATAAAVWLHGAAASAYGPGLIAEDLTETLPAVLGGLGTT